MEQMRLIDAEVIEKYIKKHIWSLNDNAQHYSMESVPVEVMDAVLHDILTEVQTQPEIKTGGEKI